MDKEQTALERLRAAAQMSEHWWMEDGVLPGQMEMDELMGEGAQ